MKNYFDIEFESEDISAYLSWDNEPALPPLQDKPIKTSYATPADPDDGYPLDHWDPMDTSEEDGWNSWLESKLR